MSYCGLVDARIRASEKDLPVKKSEENRIENKQSISIAPPPPTVLCIAVKVAVCHEIDTKCDFYDFPMPVYALETIYINFLRNF